MDLMTHSAMREDKSSSTAQDRDSPPNETSGRMDGASRLLRLAAGAELPYARLLLKLVP